MAESILAWSALALLVIVGGIYFTMYVIDEHEKYLDKRRHGWQ